MTTPTTDRPPIEIDPEHTAALTRAGTLVARVRYACDHQSPPVTTQNVRDWLAAYGYPTGREQRSYVSRLVNAWRAERGMADTGDQVALTPERLAELDAIERDAAGPELDAPADVTPPAPAEPIEAPAATAPPAPTPAPTTPPAAAGKARGTGPFYAVAVFASLISLDTSYRFFGEKLQIIDQIERAALCGIVEMTLIACGYAMRHNVRRPAGTPGPAQLVALALCGVAAFMAVSLGGPVAGTVRALLGPALALVALHLALGIEVKVRQGESKATFARVVRELRERLLSRLGLADDDRTALARTRDRAADRAARLATSKHTPFRRRRLARAVRQSNVAIDPRQRARLVAQVTAQRSLDDLLTLDVVSPWGH